MIKEIFPYFWIFAQNYYKYSSYSTNIWINFNLFY